MYAYPAAKTCCAGAAPVCRRLGYASTRRRQAPGTASRSLRLNLGSILAVSVVPIPSGRGRRELVALSSAHSPNRISKKS